MRRKFGVINPIGYLKWKCGVHAVYSLTQEHQAIAAFIT